MNGETEEEEKVGERGRQQGKGKGEDEGGKRMRVDGGEMNTRGEKGWMELCEMKWRGGTKGAERKSSHEAGVQGCLHVNLHLWPPPSCLCVLLESSINESVAGQWCDVKLVFNDAPKLELLGPLWRGCTSESVQTRLRVSFLFVWIGDWMHVSTRRQKKIRRDSPWWRCKQTTTSPNPLLCSDSMNKTLCIYMMPHHIIYHLYIMSIQYIYIYCVI